ncbi:hypothetical protein KTD15_32315, partial [Burkholderia multivorans]|nr:hypothetical protein [Burkholderia multivorans]
MRGLDLRRFIVRMRRERMSVAGVICRRVVPDFSARFEGGIVRGSEGSQRDIDKCGQHDRRVVVVCGCRRVVLDGRVDHRRDVIRHRRCNRTRCGRRRRRRRRRRNARGRACIANANHSRCTRRRARSIDRRSGARQRRPLRGAGFDRTQRFMHARRRGDRRGRLVGPRIERRALLRRRRHATARRIRGRADARGSAGGARERTRRRG